MKRIAPVISDMPCIIHGADYNPEQWIKWKDTIWKEDMRLAKEAGMNSLSIGIFSWSMLEPAEGQFCFEWLDEIMDMMAANGLKAVLATPTAARPAWMAQKYPEVLRTAENRVQNIFGQRHNHCMSSPVYREKAHIINSRLAKRYKDHPALGLWHLSNEVSGACHCPLCQERFRVWLREKYETLEQLNEAWWTTFWSHRYTDWSQIESPSSRGEMSTHGLALDWKRFTTELHMDFLIHEMKPLREYTPEVPCTTNLMATYEELDYVRFAQIFDLVSWDNYPGFRGETKKDSAEACRTGFLHDIMYGLKRRPFFLMESCPSTVGWRKVNKLKRPGIHMLQSLQAVAHGSDSVQYFQFRKGRGASEKLHGAVVDHEGTGNTRVYREVAEVGQKLAELSAVVGTVKPAKVALIHDYQNGWGLESVQTGLPGNQNYRRTLIEHYSVFWTAGIPVDIIDETCALDGYDLVTAPMAYLLRDGFAQRVEKFVADGGTFVTTYLSGYVNETDLCFMGGFPGPLKEVLGIWDEELDALYPEDRNTIEWNGKEYEVCELCERIHTRDARILGTYGSDFYQGTPALTCNRFGKGTAYYIAARTGTDFLTDFYHEVMKTAGIKAFFKQPLPEGVNLQLRTDGEQIYCFLMNFAGEERVVEANGRTVVMAPRSVEVLEF